MIYVIGGKGLVGSAIVRYIAKNNLEYSIIQKENKVEFFNKDCDLLIYANGNAYKYKANLFPYEDYIDSVQSIAEYVHNINYKKFILVSTVDVYDNVSNKKNTKEDRLIDTNKLSTYGFHKYIGEEYVRHFCNDFLIFRLGGLVGEGLRKNPAYDFIDKEKEVMISRDSELNFINTEYVALAIFNIINLGIKNETFNLASINNIKIKEIKNIIGYDTKYIENSDDNYQKYDICIDKISQYVKIPTSHESIERYFYSIKK